MVTSRAESPDVSIVIVSYNTRDWMVRCLEAIRLAATEHTVELIVIDNASSDDSADVAQAACPEARVIRNVTNVGFGPAVNQGGREARGRFLLLANPDGVLMPGAIDALISFAESNPQHVIVGGKTLTLDGELDSRSCWGAPTILSLLCSALLLSTLWPGSRFDPESMGWYGRDQPQVVDIVSGCLLLVRLDDWHTLGGFDERYFLYGEDADLCLRARQVTGRTCAVTPEAAMMHAVSASSATIANKKVRLLRGRVTVARTHLNGWRGRVGPSLIVSGVLIRAVLERCGVAQHARWREVWSRRREWRGGYPAERNVSSPSAAVKGH